MSTRRNTMPVLDGAGRNVIETLVPECKPIPTVDTLVLSVRCLNKVNSLSLLARYFLEYVNSSRFDLLESEQVSSNSYKSTYDIIISINNATAPLALKPQPQRLDGHVDQSTKCRAAPLIGLLTQERRNIQTAFCAITDIGRGIPCCTVRTTYPRHVLC